ncbi:MAG: tetratricopeptide repeat protein [Desulfobacteraceae bacterium]|nr:tetratricopeptide repeat protein [Desulfobacteraceae bacterium]
MASCSRKNTSVNDPFLHTPKGSQWTNTAQDNEKKPLPNQIKYTPPDEKGKTYISTDFIDQKTMAYVNRCSSFSFMAIVLDPPADPESASPLLNDLKFLLDHIQNHGKGIWFLWKGPLYGCILKNLDIQKALLIARVMQEKISKNRIETISIGICQYPFFSFTASQSLINACKALDHAAFFGSSSTAIFDSLSLNISGDQFYQTGDMQNAIAEYKAALMLDQNNSNIHNSLGVCMAKLNNLTEAEKSFRSALILNPHDPMALYNLGIVHLLRKKPQNAFKLLKKAYSLDKQTFEITYQLGKLLLNQGNFKTAKILLEKSIGLRKNSAPALCLLGQCLMKLEKVTESICAFKKVIKISPNYAPALSALGVLYEARGESLDIWPLANKASR